MADHDSHDRVHIPFEGFRLTQAGIERAVALPRLSRLKSVLVRRLNGVDRSQVTSPARVDLSVGWEDVPIDRQYAAEDRYQVMNGSFGNRGFLVDGPPYSSSQCFSRWCFATSIS